MLRISILHGINYPSEAYSLERFRLEDVVGLEIGVLNSTIFEFNDVSSLADAWVMQASSEGLGIDIVYEEAGVEE